MSPWLKKFALLTLSVPSKRSASTSVGKWPFVQHKKPLPTPQDEVGNTTFQSLRGRDLLSFEGYTRNDIHSLLWIATELRSNQVPAGFLAQFSKKRIGLVWNNPIVKASLSHAGNQIKSSVCTFHEQQLKNAHGDFEMLGRCLASATDIMFIDAPSWDKESIEKFALGSPCPVITISSKEYSPALAYTELLTLFLKYGFIRRLVITSIRPGNDPMLNTYFVLLPTLGMHLRYLLQNSSVENPAAWEAGLKISTRKHTELKEVDNLNDALYRAHTISACFHDSPYSNLTLKQIEEMDLDWSFIQHDLFKGSMASQDIMRQKDNYLVYDVISNQTWIFQALIVGHTSDYTPQKLPPRFEGPP